MTEVQFPVDWLDPHAGDVATDLDLAVLLVNSFDALANPPDRLHDLDWWSGALVRVGHADLADVLRDDDLESLRSLREDLREAFRATTVQQAADALNPLLAAAGAVPLLAVAADRPTGAGLRYESGAAGLAALRVRLPVAVVERIVSRGVRSLGTCAADPCSCVFVDRTRAVTRRYCCGWCNDRAAARAYRRRQSH
jgi:predicted RNA-binding Zn ribbon-like protein